MNQELVLYIIGRTEPKVGPAAGPKPGPRLTDNYVNLSKIYLYNIFYYYFYLHFNQIIVC